MAKKKLTTKSARQTTSKKPSAVTAKKPPTKPAAKSSAKSAVKPKPAPVKKTTAAVASSKPRPSRPEPVIEEFDPTKVKSPFGKREVNEYRRLLLEKRAEILGDMSSMSEEALRKNDSANLSHMPLHMADVGSDNYEQELTLGLVESERRILQEINEALQRISDGTFGVCQSTGKPISKPRLAATPWAKYSIEAARAMERGGRRF